MVDNVGSFATLYVTLDADEERIDPQRCEGVIFCTNAHCDDGSLCTFDRCIDNVCVRTPSVRGDIAGPGGSCEADGGVDLSDILAVLDGFGGDFAEGCELVNIDIAGDEGSCDPNDIIDLSDITAVLDAFAGDRDVAEGVRALTGTGRCALSAAVHRGLRWHRRTIGGLLPMMLRSQSARLSSTWSLVAGK